MASRGEIVAFLGFLLPLLSLQSAAAQPVRFVDDDAPLGGDGLTWPTAYRFLQDALAEASADSTISELRVAQGTYKPDQDEGGNVTWGDRAATIQLVSDVALRGGYAGLGEPDPDDRNIELYETILSGDLAGNDGPDFAKNGENSYHVVVGSNTENSAVLEGFTIRAGHANGDDPFDDDGAGLYCDSGSPTITDCSFTGNMADAGAGLYFYRSISPLITNCSISDNAANNRGGGIVCWLSAPTFSNCSIVQNTAPFIGGGLYSCESNQTFVECEFACNVGGDGGAVFMGGEGVPRFLGCSITENATDGSPGKGGGVWCGSLCRAIISHCVLENNEATFQGGALWCADNDLTIISTTITQNTAGIAGGAIYCWADSELVILNSTIANNQADSGKFGGGIHCSADARPVLHNSILWGNSPQQIFVSEDSEITVRYSDVQGGQEGVGGDATLIWEEGNIDDDPIFLDPMQGDFHLLPSSPCIDGGDPGYVVETSEVDTDGEPRVFNNHLDMGADEYHDCNGNGSADYQDIVDGTSEDCTGNSIPDECEADCNLNLLADSCDIDIGTSKDCTLNGIPDECEPDCNGNNLADSCDIAVGSSDDCNTNGVPDECIALENDCNSNGTPDECDTVQGASADCDGNSVPDECQDTSSDCNSSGIWDPCELVENPNLDADRDGTLDECEQLLLIYIDDNAPADPGPGDASISDPAEDGSLAHPFDAIQEAINAAEGIEDGNPSVNHFVEIIVADGTYTGIGNRNVEFHGRAYLLRSENGSANCTVSCDAGRGFRFAFGETPGTRVQGFTVKGGVATSGGGIACEDGSNPTIVACTISGNFATSTGGGVFCNSSSPTLIGCLIVQNTATVSGGGIYCIDGSHPTIDGCTFLANVASLAKGGGISCEDGSSPTIRNCVFIANSADSSGGGVSCVDTSNAAIVKCSFAQNLAGHLGGGVYYSHSHPVIINCSFTGNSADQAGGGVMCHLSSSSVISNCLVSGNSANVQGGGVTGSNCRGLEIINCTITDNTSPDSSGLRSWGGSLAVSNSIIWGNTPQTIVAENYSELTIRHSNIQGGESGIGGVNILTWESGNIDVDPLFVDPGNGSYFLSPGSPTIDAGQNSVVPQDAADLDGDGDPNESVPIDLDGSPRFVDDPATFDSGDGLPPIVDMGTYEFQGMFQLGDLNCDGNMDPGDVDPLVLALIEPLNYVSAFPGCSIALADVNGDGKTDGGDIAGFVSLLLFGP